MECLVKADMIRAVGNGMICGHPRQYSPLANRSYRTLRDGLLERHIPGISCQATIIRSLRDKHSCALMLTRMDSRRMSLPAPYRTDKISLQLQGVLPSYRRQPPGMGGQKIR